MVRITALLCSATALAACLMTIDESKIGQAASVDGALPPNESTDAAKEDAPLPTCGDGIDIRKDLRHCGACDHPCSDKEVCREGTCVTPGSCKELHASRPEAATGVHDLMSGGTVVPAFCDMETDGGGFTLVYRVSAGVSGNPDELFSGPEVNDQLAAEATFLPTKVHYVSRLLAHWNLDFVVERARARLVDEAGAILRDLVFDARGSSRTSFFAKDKLLENPWTDLANAFYFSAGGHKEAKRHFFIHKNYSTCDQDEGWLVVHGTFEFPPCDYEKPANLIRIYYAPGMTAQRWVTAMPEARAFSILAR